jgi:hypothetical protein
MSSAPGRPDLIFLHRRIALVRPHRIDIRPSPSAIIGPLFGVGLGVTAALAIWFGMGRLPLPLLAVLLVVAIVAIPFSGIGLVYALLGAHVVIDSGKQSATWQQGFLGMGVGTTELVPFWKMAGIAVSEAGVGEAERGRRTEEFAQWRLTLVKESGRRLEIGQVVVPRSLAQEGYATATDLAGRIAALTGAPLELPPPEDGDEPEEPVPVPATRGRHGSTRRNRRRARRR